ncbi:MAG: DUF502 domain-containing protein [Planctomycetes bacterium]|nr:DUF502 domain-containing protein [Planctomycetota bacterium]
MSAFSKAFFKGLSILLPALITIAIFAWAWDILRTYVVELSIRGIDSIKVIEPRKLTEAELNYLDDENFYQPIGPDGLPTVGSPPHTIENLKNARPKIGDLPPETQGLTPPFQERSVLQFILDSNDWHREYDRINGDVRSYHWFEYLLSAVLGIVIVILLGFGTRNFFGRKLGQLVEWMVTRVPIIKAIYPHAKQLVQFFFSDGDKKIEFDTVAIIEYPRPGLWSLIFVTGTGLATLQRATGKRLVTVYVPSSPAPMTGYTMFIAAEDVIPIDLKVEEAMKLIVSGGVLTPDSEKVRPVSGAQKNLAGGIDRQVRDRQTSLVSKSQMLRRLEDRVMDEAANGNGRNKKDSRKITKRVKKDEKDADETPAS